MAPLASGSVSLRLYPHDLPATDQVEVLRRQARRASEIGYDGVMVSEHHADFPGYLPNPVQLAGLLLDAMPTGWVAPCPMLLPLKPYALIAEDLAWLAAAYPGRVGVGFAAGALPVDFELAEIPFDEIVDRFKTALPKIVDALRGHDPGPLGTDRAIGRLVDDPMPIVIAAQSAPACRRAARLGCGVLYDSLQSSEVSARLGAAHCEAGAETGRVLIRRVWIGPPPEAEMAAQMDHYRSYANEAATKNWTDDSLVHGDTPIAAAEALLDVLAESDCDTVNVRVHVKGLTPAQVDDQLTRHADGFVDAVRAGLGS
ncbi:MAG TPA: LLM class flavin-dependent oxidoreductase [Acidimicrobiaceae bacterium]|nr:LLM class flavin-dependent oxidoreductase [Acidimicrobiaceae bacterium]